jgi:acetyl esterase
VAYRLAPESPFPAAVQDALASTRWAAAHLSELGGNDALAVAGDSAGGNLAAVVAQQLRTTLAAQLLMYPSIDVGDDVEGRYPSRVENGSGYFLDTPTMAWFHEQYAAHVTAPGPLLSPMLATDLAGVAPAVLVTAEYDPLRDEGEAYAKKLDAAGVRVEVRRFPGMIHGFFDMGPVSAAAAAAVDETCTMLAKVLHP